jgi:hypothetical protein
MRQDIDTLSNQIKMVLVSTPLLYIYARGSLCGRENPEEAVGRDGCCSVLGCRVV